jgi:hypothetical protein
MINPTPFRHYLISQDAGGGNIEVARSAEQVGVLAFDLHQLCFVHCHVLMEPLQDRQGFDERSALLSGHGHPLLARLVESGEDDGNGFYITDHVDGETLGDYLARLDEIPLWLAMRLALQAARALEACLECGDFLPALAQESLRVVQTGPLDVEVILSDYRMIEESRTKAARGRLVISAFDKQVRFLNAFFEERKQSAASGGEIYVSASDFAEMFFAILASAGPGSIKSVTAFCETLKSSMHLPAEAELAAPFKPKPLLAAHLATSQEVARSIVQFVRIQSQKIDSAQPYAMRGTFLKSSQSVIVEQIPPRRLAGVRPSEIVHQVQIAQRSGKYPNLVPVVFTQEKEGIECVAETAVEGVSLKELLQARGALQPQEIYLVLAGLDTALGQIEKSAANIRRIRLEDVLLYTGLGKENPREGGLLNRKLNEWPGFSIVLRTHPCLHSMACRGTDPALMLPLNIKAPQGVEILWHGGWMAALGSFLMGISPAKSTNHNYADTQSESVARLLEDELDKARRNNPSARSGLLARFVRVLQQHDQVNFQGGLWAELSGSATEVDQADEVEDEVENEVDIAPAPALDPVPPAKGDIGFAELLISGPSSENSGQIGLRRMGSERRYQVAQVESSWMSLRQERPMWQRLLILLVASLIIGAALATLSGRAIWQSREPLAVQTP